MIYLHLNTLMPNCAIHTDTIAWEMQNLEFSQNAKVAISSITINSRNLDSQIIPIRCNLVENSPLNQDGTIICAELGTFTIRCLPSLEFWKLDKTFPRQILFTFADVNISAINFLAVTLVIQDT